MCWIVLIWMSWIIWLAMFEENVVQQLKRTDVWFGGRISYSKYIRLATQNNWVFTDVDDVSFLFWALHCDCLLFEQWRSSSIGNLSYDNVYSSDAFSARICQSAPYRQLSVAVLFYNKHLLFSIADNILTLKANSIVEADDRIPYLK
jgi:hypothetical protein